MNGYGHLFPDELDRLADGLDGAYRAAAPAGPAQPAGAVVALR
jgi:hypothetical protein